MTKYDKELDTRTDEYEEAMKSKRPEGEREKDAEEQSEDKSDRAGAEEPA